MRNDWEEQEATLLTFNKNQKSDAIFISSEISNEFCVFVWCAFYKFYKFNCTWYKDEVNILDKGIDDDNCEEEENKAQEKRDLLRQNTGESVIPMPRDAAADASQISAKVYGTYFREGFGIFAFVLLALVFLVSQSLVIGSNFLLSVW